MRKIDESPFDTWTADVDDPLGEYPPDIREDVRAALNQIITGFSALAELLGEREAHRRFSALAEAAKPPPRRKSSHDARFNAHLLLADIEAPPGRRMQARRAVAKRFGREVTDAALVQQVRRLRRRGLTGAEMLHLPPGGRDWRAERYRPLFPKPPTNRGDK